MNWRTYAEFGDRATKRMGCLTSDHHASSSRDYPSGFRFFRPAAAKAAFPWAVSVMKTRNAISREIVGAWDAPPDPSVQLGSVAPYRPKSGERVRGHA